MMGRKMTCGYNMLKVILYLFVAVLRSTKGDECYDAVFSDDVGACPDFDNQVVKCNPLNLDLVEGKEGELALQGTIDLEQEIDDEITINLEVWKVADSGREYMYHVEANVCSSLKDKKAPWFPLVEAMEISECPIAMKSYNIKDMGLDLAGLKEMLTHDQCGEYAVQFSMKKGVDKISCHELGIAISEVSCDKKEE